MSIRRFAAAVGALFLLGVAIALISLKVAV